MSDPLISILMPVYNGARFLQEAVASVLAQEVPGFELLIIDDGSVDESAAIASRINDKRIRLIRNEANLGLVRTLNRGLDEARGPFIARCDADDLWLPARLRAQLLLLRLQPTVALVGTNAELIDENGAYRGQFRSAPTHDLLCWDLCFRNPFVHSTVLFRRSIAQELGGYREIPAAEDFDLWSRIAERHRIASVPHPLVKYRLHSSSVMAKENASGRQQSYTFLQSIMTENLRRFADDDRLAAKLGAWLEPASDRRALREFWRCYAGVWASYRKKHRLPRANATMGEHVLNMLYRQREAGKLSPLACLTAMTFGQLRSMPWIRAAGAFRPVK